MPTTSIKFTQTDVVTLSRGQCIVLDFDWSGGSVCGSGPDDESPEIGDVRGWIEQPSGQTVRDLTSTEIETLTVDTGPVMGWMLEAIHEQYNEGPDPDWDMP